MSEHAPLAQTVAARFRLDLVDPNPVNAPSASQPEATRLDNNHSMRPLVPAPIAGTRVGAGVSGGLQRGVASVTLMSCRDLAGAKVLATPLPLYALPEQTRVHVLDDVKAAEEVCAMQSKGVTGREPTKLTGVRGSVAVEKGGCSQSLSLRVRRCDVVRFDVGSQLNACQATQRWTPACRRRRCRMGCQASCLLATTRDARCVLAPALTLSLRMRSATPALSRGASFGSGDCEDWRRGDERLEARWRTHWS